MSRLLILTNSLGGLYSFRKEPVLRLLEGEHEVLIAAPPNEYSGYFRDAGCKVIESCIERRGTSIVADAKLFFSYLKILTQHKPDLVLTYTIKPNVYGGLACALLKIPYLATVTGLGTSIENGGLLRIISLLLYKFGLSKAHCVFFQNEANKELFEKRKLIRRKSQLVPGSGVNLQQHCFEEYPEDPLQTRLLYIGRIMKAKGIDELLEAAKRVKEFYGDSVTFELVGDCEEDYTDYLNMLQKERIIEYHGRQFDVHPYIKRSHAVVNPSYHEGMSNALLEAASTGRPVLASTVPGCRETFDEGVSGFGFHPGNVDSLVHAITKFIEQPYERKKSMGLAGRRKMEREFDRNNVLNAYLEEINAVISEKQKRLS